MLTLSLVEHVWSSFKLEFAKLMQEQREVRPDEEFLRESIESVAQRFTQERVARLIDSNRTYISGLLERLGDVELTAIIKSLTSNEESQ